MFQSLVMGAWPTWPHASTTGQQEYTRTPRSRILVSALRRVWIFKISRQNAEEATIKVHSGTIIPPTTFLSAALLFYSLGHAMHVMDECDSVQMCPHLLSPNPGGGRDFDAKDKYDGAECSIPAGSVPHLSRARMCLILPLLGASLAVGSCACGCWSRRCFCRSRSRILRGGEA